MKSKIHTYVVSISIALSVGSLAAHFTKEGMQTLYATILTPPWAPPSALFPFVWTILYALMGVSAAMIWREKQPEVLIKLTEDGFGAKCDADGQRQKS